MMRLTFKDETKNVAKAKEKGAFRSFSHGAFRISKTAKDSIERREGPSEPGTPPHTHRRVFIRRAIRYKASKEGAVIGPRFSIVGTAGAAHEHGGEYKGAIFPERPFMAPALEENLDRFAAGWGGSISG